MKETEEIMGMIKEEGAAYFARERGNKVEVGLYLEHIIEERGMKKKDIVRKLNLEESYARKLFGGQRIPTRKILLQCAFLLSLNLSDTQRLLDIGQKPRLYPRVRYDAAIIYGLEEKMTLEEMNEVKSFFDKGIVSKDYTGLETCVIEIPESIKFATYACIAVDFELKGKKIRHTKRGFISRLFITIFPEETKSYIILSCLSEDIKIYKKFFQQLQTTNLDKVKYYFDLILPLYTENNVLSPRLWEKWGEEQQIGYTFFANRKGKQFLLYKQILKFGMYNLRKKESGFGTGNRGKLDLFE